MVRLNDFEKPEREAWAQLPLPTIEGRPWVSGPPLAERRVAIVSTAGLMHRGDRPFTIRDNDYRIVRGDRTDDLVMGHTSVNFDRGGFQDDLNVVFPLDRLRELAEAGAVGSVADYHYSFMGAADPLKYLPPAQYIAGLLKDDGVQGVVLAGV